MSAAVPVPEAAAGCFHCGLPVSAGARWRSVVLGVPREFCCAGCLAIAQTIADEGLEDYYRLRTAPAPAPSEPAETDGDDVLAGASETDGSLCAATLYIEGARCPACLWLNAARLRALAGVAAAEANWTAQTVALRWDPARVAPALLLETVRSIGYRARPVDPSHRREIDADARRRGAAALVFAGFVGMMIMNLALAAYLVGGPDASGRLALWEITARWSCLAAAAALLAYPGREFFAGAWRDLRHRRAGMDVPIASK
jgi:Cu2+-exporting ATPase